LIVSITRDDEEEDARINNSLI